VLAGVAVTVDPDVPLNPPEGVQANEFAPEAFRVVASPEHKTGSLAEAETTGRVNTDNAIASVPVHPFTSVPTTV
jgi:hypothetical protein